LVVLELNEVEIDHCLDCGGIWLDAGELELLLGHSRHVRQFLDSFHPCLTGREKIHKCPLCRKKMLKIHTGPQPSDPIIDMCPTRQGLWFEKNELTQVISRGTLDPQNIIVKLLAEMFPKPGEFP
jgi:hypothetical protein